MKKYFYFILACLSVLITSCIHDDENEGGICQQTLYLYSLGLDGQDQLQDEVAFGNLYLLFPETGDPGHEYFHEPIPTIAPLEDALPNIYDVVFVGNVTNQMNFSFPSRSSRDAGFVKVAPNPDEEGTYLNADDVHFGVLQDYEINQSLGQAIDSVHVRRVVGKVTVTVTDLPLQLPIEGHFLLNGLAEGVDLFGTPQETPVMHYRTSAPESGVMMTSFTVFPSVDSLWLHTDVLSSGMSIGYEERNISRIPEYNKLEANQHIWIEYRFDPEGLILMNVTFKGWDQEPDYDENDAETPEN